MRGALAEDSVGQAGRTDCAGRTLRQPYSGTFYANDFSYLEDPCLPAYDSSDALARLTDGAKRVDLGSNVVVDFGGEVRLRYHDEDNLAKSRLERRDNSFVLTRVRLYGDLELGQQWILPPLVFRAIGAH